MLATLVVDSPWDDVDAAPTDGMCRTASDVCTLRAAVQTANALSGSDTIVLSAGTYSLSLPGANENAAATGDLDVTDMSGETVIQGVGQGATILDGAQLDRVFDVLDGADLRLEHLTVTGGRIGTNERGGGIRSAGHLTVRNSTIRHNEAPGLLQGGGGISVSGVTEIRDSTISHNEAGGQGGGILNRNLLQVIGSTIHDNVSGRLGGGIETVFFGGGQTVTIANSTISGNIADEGAGGINVEAGSQSGNVFRILNSTVTQNQTTGQGGYGDGGGVLCGGAGVLCSANVSLELQNTIVAGNQAAGSSPDVLGPFTSLGFNLVGDPSGSTGFPGVGDQLSVPAVLLPLADNGGPTWTHALAPGSLALDAGVDATGAGVDQRGVPRPQSVTLGLVPPPFPGDASDIGAYEVANKEVVATSEPSTKGTEVMIGEIVRYRLQVVLPEDTYPSLQVIDYLDPGLQLVDLSQVKIALISDNGFTPISGANTLGSTPIAPTFTLPASQIATSPGLSFDLGTITNNDSDPNSEYLIIEYNALVMNTPLNRDGDLKANWFALEYGNPVVGARIVRSSAATLVRIVEPHLEVDKRVVAHDGQTVTFEVTIKNTGNSTAFDATFDDPYYVGPPLVFDLSPGSDSLTITYDVDVRQCEEIHNRAAVSYTSLPGPRGTPPGSGSPNSTGSATPGDTDDLDGERLYEAADEEWLVGAGDFVWEDWNGDGQWQSPEPGIPGVVVTATWADPDGLFNTTDDLTLSTTTDLVGHYRFCGLPQGDYMVAVDPSTLPGQMFSTYDPDGGGDATTLWTLGPSTDDIDFGFAFPASIHGFKFEDLNGDGSWQFGEPKLAGVTIRLTWDDPNLGLQTLETVTMENGEYWFENLRPGFEYTVSEVPPECSVQTSAAPDPILLHSGQRVTASEQIGLRTGNGSVGGPDSLIRMLVNPGTGALVQDDFDDASSGPLAQIVVNTVPWKAHLDQDPAADWIATAQGSEEHALYAIDFVIASPTIAVATLDFTFLVDNALGNANNEGLFINSIPIPDSKRTSFTPEHRAFNHDQQLPTFDITNLVRWGLNTLYVYHDNVSGPAGIQFSAAINVLPESPNSDPTIPDPVTVDPRLGFGNAFCGSIHGFKFEDMNGNGVYEPDDGDLGMDDVVFSASPVDDQGVEGRPMFTETMGGGEFWFTDLPPNQRYTVREVRDPLILVVPNASSLIDGETFTVQYRGTTITFELDFNSAAAPGNVGVALTSADSAADVAAKLVEAIAASPLGLTPLHLGGGRVVLGDAAAVTANTSATGINQSVGGPASGSLATTPPSLPLMIRSGQEYVAFPGQAHIEPRAIEVAWAGSVANSNVATDHEATGRSDDVPAAFLLPGTSPGPLTANYREFRFDELGSFSDWAALLGLSEQIVRNADFVAFEYNGSSANPAGNVFETSDWNFFDGKNSFSLSHNFIIPTALNPQAYAGTIANADDAAFFGFANSHLNVGNFAYFLVDIDGHSNVDPALPYFRVTLTAAGTTGPNSPEPDAMARLTSVYRQREVVVGETLMFGNAFPGSVHGSKWLDVNANGQWDEGEPEIPGVTIYADLNENGRWDEGEPSSVTMTSDDATLECETEYRFDTDMMGWTPDPTTGSDPGNKGAFWSPGNGNPGGYIRFIDPDGANLGRLQAPAGSPFLGDLTSLFDGTYFLKYDFRIFQSDTAQGWTPYEVSMTGGPSNSITATWRGDTPTGITGWKTIEVPLHKSDWIISGGAWADLLANVTNFDIRIELSDNTAINDERTGIDNIILCRAVDMTGHYWLEDLPPGEYTIREVVPPGYEPTSPAGGAHVVQVRSGETLEGFDFGNVFRGFGNFYEGVIRGFKFDDSDGDGFYEPANGERRVPFVQIHLDVDENKDTIFDRRRSTLTDANGDFEFTGLGPGWYQISEEVPPFATQTTIAPPLIDLLSGDVYVAVAGQADPLAPHQVEVVEPLLAIGNHYEGYGAIHGCKFNDRNGNGVRDDGEPPLAGVAFQLSMLNPDGNWQPMAIESTVSTGAFWFSNLWPGRYRLEELPIPGAFPTTPHVVEFEIGPGDEIQLGLCAMPGAIHGRKFADRNFNRQRDGNEPWLNGFTIELRDPQGNLVASSTTMDMDINGDSMIDPETERGWYWFEDVPPGDYTVVEIVSAGWIQTYPAAGAHQVSIALGEVLTDLDFGNAHPVIFGDGVATPIADAHLTTVNDRLVVSNIGSSGEGGVSIELDHATYAEITFAEPVTPVELGDFVEIATRGTAGGVADQPLGVIRHTNVALGVLEVRADFPAYPGVTVKVRMFDAGRLVGTYHVPQGVIGRLSLAPPGPGAGEGEAGDPVPGLEVTVVQVPGGGPVQLSSRSTLQIGGTIALTGDTLMLAPDCSACDIETIESIAITGSGLNTIVIADVVTEAPPELPDLARIELRTVDAAGNHLDAVEPGDTFVLEAYATDLRPVPGGVFAAYVDVLFDATLVAIDGPLTIGDQFPIARSGDTTTAGLLDEVGGSGGLEPNAGDGLLFRVLLQAADLGRVDFQANEADQLPLHHVLLRESDDAVPAARVQFVGTSLIVRHPPWSNFDNPTDVNGDGTTAPIDVLLLINEINRRSISDPATGALPEPGGAVVPPPYLDVNGDRALTPIDVLIVINRLNGMGQQAGGEGEAFAFPAELHPAPSQPFAASPLRMLISTAGPSRPPAAFPTIPQDVRDGSRHPQAYRQPPARPVQEFGEGRDGELEKVIGEIVGDVATAWMA